MIWAVLGICSIFSITQAWATILPYSIRTRDFSSWTPGARGDINTIGMAGATLALPTSISAAEANPAGYGMLTGSVSAQINKVNLNDKRLQHSGDPIESSQWGFGLSSGGWGLSIAYYSPETESGTYVSPNTGDTVKTEVSIKELRLTVARAFFDERLSIGVSLEIAKGVRELDDASSNAFAPSYRLGLLYLLPLHLVFGASFSPEISVGPAGNPDPETVLPGFNRRVVLPLQSGIGLGWIPNRFFKLGGSLTYIAKTQNTALLADQLVATGVNPTWVPRVGASYVLAEFSNLKVEGSAGSYFEASRLSDQSNRLHATAGLEANPYFVNLGVGFDISSDYRNYMVSIGFDIVRAARAFDLIPKEPVPPYNGLWPPLSTISAEGLPAGLTGTEWREHKAQTVEQVEKIVGDVPQNIVKRVEGRKTTVNTAEDKKKRKNPDATQPSKP